MCDAPPQSLFLRQYGIRVGDYQTVDSWWRARYGFPFPENQCPPLGIICEIDGVPAGCLFAYQAAGIGVAFLEFGVTSPGTSFKTARMIFARLLHGIILCLKKDGCGLVRCFAENAAVERCLFRFGFQGRDRNLYLFI
jgi:hypothetical protein